MIGLKIKRILAPHVGALEIPVELLDLLDGDDILFVNGCGAADSFLSLFIPQFYDRIDLRAACIVHDYMYTFAETLQEKISADVAFLHNLNLIFLNAKDNLSINTNRRQKRFDRAMTYFMYVHRYGEKVWRAGIGIPSRKVKEYIKDIPDADSLKILCTPVGHRGSEEDEYL